MTTRQLFLLAIAPSALIVVGIVAMQTATGLIQDLGGETVSGFVRASLDRPDKLTPDHVDSVLNSAGAIEAATRKARESALGTFHGFGLLCIQLGILGFAATALAAFAGRGREQRLAGSPPSL